MEIEKHYNLKETANILGQKVRTVWQWVHDGYLKAKKYDGKRMWFVSKSEIERLQNKGE